MSCLNYKWGAWIPGNLRGKKYFVINPHPLKARSKIWIDGEWTGKNKCRKWTKEEIETGIGHTKKYGDLKLFPIKCGHCELCNLAKSNEWVTRIMCEFFMKPYGVKIDLTYAPKYVPDGYKLKKSDYQSFINRLRTHLKRTDPNFTGFKYYIGGEYGPVGGRPHYHIILVGWQPSDMKYWKDSKSGFPMYTSELIENKWGMGICTVEYLTPETVSYTTRYTRKKSGNAKVNAGVPEFQAQSQGIGIEYWAINKEKIKDNLGIWIKRGDKADIAPIPRAFKKQWKLENPIEYECFCDWQMLTNERIENERKKRSNLSKIEYLHNCAETRCIRVKKLGRGYYEEQQEKTLDAANNNGYNIHVHLCKTGT